MPPRASTVAAPSTGTAVAYSEQTLHSLTWDLNIDTNDTSVNLRLPLQCWLGEVVLSVRVLAPQSLWFKFDLRGCEPGSLQGLVTPRADLFWTDEGVRPTLLASTVQKALGDFPDSNPTINVHLGQPADFDSADKSYAVFQRKRHRRFKITFGLQSSPPPPPSVDSTDEDTLSWDAAKLLGPSFFTKRPNDIRLFFPRTNAELWTSSSILTAASPYFKTMLESGVGVENVQRSGRKRLRSGVPTRGASLKVEEESPINPESNVNQGLESRKEESEADDSDEETDDMLASTRSLAHEEMDDDGDFTYREITITEAAYSTYRAVLLYLVTSHIYFAILRSSLLPYNPAAEFTRKQVMETELEEERLPVSVKSVYGLADLLELPALKILALDEFRTQLSVVNVARELFSSTSALYDEFRTAALDFAVEHWSEVKETEGMKEIERKGKAGEWQGSPALFFELMARAAK